jgi:uncharacterized 2Fe-2S/4Fe-4S cluster protein (DUF4445 family)
MIHTIKVLSHGLQISAEAGAILSDVLQAAGIPLSVYCDRRGLCGKCFVEVVGGPLPSPSARESRWIKDRRLHPDSRLACQLRVSSDLAINVPPASIVRAVPVLPEIPRSAVTPDPAVRKYELEIPKPEISSPQSLFDTIADGLGLAGLRIYPTVLSGLPGVVEEGRFDVTVAVHSDGEIISVEPRAGSPNLGLAIDVGTTTLVMDLVDLDSGKTIDTEAALNGQGGAQTSFRASATPTENQTESPSSGSSRSGR